MLTVSALCRKGTKTKLAICAAAMLGMMVLPVSALAHKVNVFAYVEGESVVVEGYFSKDARAQDCRVLVFDQSGKQIHEGKTDRKGMYSFKLADLPAFSGSLKIVMVAGMGHKADFTLSAEDLPAAVKKDAQPQKQTSEPKPQQVGAPNPEAKVSVGAPVVDQAALLAAVDAMMNKKLAPITRMLGNQEKLLLEEKFGGPKMTDIIGGIGWIMGLVGLATFFWGRNRNRSHGTK